MFVRFCWVAASIAFGVPVLRFVLWLLVLVVVWFCLIVALCCLCFLAALLVVNSVGWVILSFMDLVVL